MSKEAIEKRLVELRKSLEQVQANGNALIGAIQECEYWLKNDNEAGHSVEAVEHTDSGGLPEQGGHS
jgi:hypothetical protein